MPFYGCSDGVVQKNDQKNQNKRVAAVKIGDRAREKWAEKLGNAVHLSVGSWVLI